MRFNFITTYQRHVGEFLLLSFFATHNKRHHFVTTPVYPLRYFWTIRGVCDHNILKNIFTIFPAFWNKKFLCIKFHLYQQWNLLCPLIRLDTTGGCVAFCCTGMGQQIVRVIRSQMNGLKLLSCWIALTIGSHSLITLQVPGSPLDVKQGDPAKNFSMNDENSINISSTYHSKERLNPNSSKSQQPTILSAFQLKLKIKHFDCTLFLIVAQMTYNQRKKKFRVST